MISCTVGNSGRTISRLRASFIAGITIVINGLSGRLLTDSVLTGASPPAFNDPSGSLPYKVIESPIKIVFPDDQESAVLVELE